MYVDRVLIMFGRERERERETIQSFFPSQENALQILFNYKLKTFRIFNGHSAPSKWASILFTVNDTIHDSNSRSQRGCFEV